MDALIEFLLHTAMTLSAGSRDCELENRRLGICWAKNLVRSVTVRADRCLRHAPGDCLAMHAFLISQEWLCAAAARFHHKFFVVTGAAGEWNVGMVSARLGIAGGETFVHIAVTIRTTGCWPAAGLGSRM